MDTIDDKVKVLMRQLPYVNKTEGGVEGFRGLLRLALREVAREQRHACAEAVMVIKGSDNNPWMIDKDEAHSAVMNAAPTPGSKGVMDNASDD